MPPLLTLLLVLSLSACGYHLRGSRADAPGLLPVAVSAPGSAQLLAQQLHQRLDNRGWAGSAHKAQMVIVVNQEKIDRQTSSLTTAGLVSEYRVHYSVSYELRDERGRVLQPAQQITHQRLYRFDPTQALAMTWQEQRLEQTMRGLAIDEIMRRLSHVKPISEPARDEAVPR